MKFHQIKQKLDKVMESCNKPQEKTGKKYCQMLIDRFTSNNGHDNVALTWYLKHWGTNQPPLPVEWVG